MWTILLFFLISAEASTVHAQDLCYLYDGDSHRIDCHPEKGATEASCNARQCCWIPAPEGADHEMPWCYYPRFYPFYSMQGEVEMDADTNNATQRSIITKPPERPFHLSKDVLKLQVEATYETENRGRIRIIDPVNQRWEVPISMHERDVILENTDWAKYEIHQENNEDGVFGIWVVRKSDNKSIFDTRVASAPLIYTDQFLQLTTRLQGDYIYGLGETRHVFPRSTSKWRTTVLNAQGVGKMCEHCNLYGVHNFFLASEPNTGESYGILLLNSNVQEVVLQPGPLLTYRTLGGVLDFYFFVGNTPSQVLDEYWGVVGTPTLPPMWALGFHLSRYGWNDLDHAEADYNRNVDEYMPIDAVWTEIEYMDRRRPFTTNTDSYARLPEFVKRVRETDGRRMILLVEPAIPKTDTPGEYPPYDSGVANKVFITGEDGSTPLEANMWPGLSVYPDFSNNGTTKEWWAENIKKFYEKVQFDGLWLNMNEPVSFDEGSHHGCSHAPEDHKLNFPPYLPATIYGGTLNYKSICASAKQSLGRHYDLHNLYGYQSAEATHAALKQLFPDKRPFVMSRSTFMGVGRYAYHWTGDNSATWKDMYHSLAAIFNFNMFGMPFTGADVCGYNNEPDENLCVRWMQLGAFYPFMRSHNTKGTRGQDPASFSPQARMLIRKALIRRYNLIPYIYSRFFEASILHRPVFKPLFFEFPRGDPELHRIDWQFMLGDALMVAPVFDPNYTNIDVVFPLKSAWCDLHRSNNESPRNYRPESETSIKEAVDVTQLERGIPAYVRGGRMIALQGLNAERPLLNTADFHAEPISLLGCTDARGVTVGNLYYDDGTTALGEHGKPKDYTHVRITTKQNSIKLYPLKKVSAEITRVIDRIEIVGVLQAPTAINITIDSEPSNSTADFLWQNDNSLTIMLDEPLALDQRIELRW